MSPETIICNLCMFFYIFYKIINLKHILTSPIIYMELYQIDLPKMCIRRSVTQLWTLYDWGQPQRLRSGSKLLRELLRSHLNVHTREATSDLPTASTGWSISILYTLYCSYDKNDVCMKKNLVGICSVHRDFSSKTNN